MGSPYADKPPSAFWRTGVAGRGPADVDPVTPAGFAITPADRLATAGSCFAQHISRALQARGIPFLVTEEGPGDGDESYGVYPARFGNIYTVRQLRQLFERAYGLFEPCDEAWRAASGCFLDPFRPTIPRGGFATVEALRADRERHLSAVQRMFEDCDVFVFTLGLTEGWESVVDGAVFPLAPGVVAEAADPALYRFRNFSVAEMDDDLRWFIAQFRRVNSAARVILTVSPVALVATYEDRHVLVSNTYSKSALRVVSELASRSLPDVAYFPSYEIITGAHARSSFLADDLRTVTPAGVAHVMGLFCKHYLGESASPSAPPAAAMRALAAEAMEAAMRARQQVICDEDLTDAGR